MNTNTSRPIWLSVAAVIAVLFGLMTIKEGGSVLFLDESRQAAGNYVPFVLWFNFLAGFAYIIGGIGLWMRRAWSVQLAFGIAAATLIVYAAFGIHILLGNAFEQRTAVAMALRLTLWSAIAFASYRAILRPSHAK